MIRGKRPTTWGRADAAANAEAPPSRIALRPLRKVLNVIVDSIVSPDIIRYATSKRLVILLAKSGTASWRNLMAMLPVPPS